VNPVINMTLHGDCILLVDGVQAGSTRLPEGIIDHLRDTVAASKIFSQVGLAGAEKEKNAVQQQRTQIQDSNSDRWLMLARS